MKFPKFRMVLWLELLDVGLTICTGVCRYTPIIAPSKG
jgi:hypothetical protein